MPAFKNIAVVGASGDIGKIILKSLIESCEFNITVISRKDSKATFPNGVAVRKVDFSIGDLAEAFAGHEAVVSVLGAAAFDQQKKLVDAALRAGVQRFFPSEYSASSQDKAVQELLPLFGVKSELIEYLNSKEAEGLSWTGIAPSGLFDWGLANGFLGYDIKNRTATVWDDGDKRFTLTNEKSLGNSVVTALQKHEETKNRYFFIASVETSQNEIVAALEKATGSKWNVIRTTTKEQFDDAARRLGAGDFTGAFNLVRGTVYGDIPGLRSNYAKDEVLANDVLGVSIEDVNEVVERVVAAN